MRRIKAFKRVGIADLAEGPFRVDMIGPIVWAFLAIAADGKTEQNRMPANQPGANVEKQGPNDKIERIDRKQRHKNTRRINQT